jgi:hypothetical protein
VERPRDAPSPSRWPCVPGRPRIRAQKVELVAPAGPMSVMAMFDNRVDALFCPY